MGGDEACTEDLQVAKAIGPPTCLLKCDLVPVCSLLVENAFGHWTPVSDHSFTSLLFGGSGDTLLTSVACRL